MKKNSVVLTAVLLGVAAGTLAHAQAPAGGAAPTKVAVINLSEAMARTKEGQKAGGDLNNKFGPRKAEYDKREAAIQQMSDQLTKGRATMSQDMQAKMNADIQNQTKDLKRYGEDAQSEMDTDEQKITQDLQTKIFPIVQQYAIQNNFAVVLDYGGTNPSPVLWAATATNITDAIVTLYDQAHPVKDDGTAKPAAAPTTPIAPVKPPTKKQ